MVANTFSVLTFSTPVFVGANRSTICRTLKSRPVAQAQPPKTKPVFYRNPSKAIEKGGGFYIPGLRGPRLRFFVASVAGSLLTINHLASTATIPSLLNSERIAAVGILAVLVTAFNDSLRSEDDAGPKISSDTETMSVTGLVEEAIVSEEQLSTSEASTWAMAVCTDLTAVTHIAQFRNGFLQSKTMNVTAGSAPGEAVNRVLEEARSLYISDTSTLPSNVTFPFLQDGVWSVYLVPKGVDVVVFAKQGKEGLSIDSRRWLDVFVDQYFCPT